MATDAGSGVGPLGTARVTVWFDSCATRSELSEWCMWPSYKVADDSGSCNA